MKKTHYLTIFTLIIVALLGINVALAESGTTTQTKDSWWNRLFEQKKEKIENEREKLEDRKEKFASTTAKIEDRIRDREDRLASSTIKLADREEKRASSTLAKRERLEERFKTGVANQIAKINDRLSDAIERIEKADTRIVAHIAKLKARNIDTTKSDALLVEAKAKLATATEKVTTLNTSLQAMLATNISTTTKNTIKAKTAEANTYVKSAHEAYVKVVVSLKPGQNKIDKGTATSTATSTATTTTP